MEPKKPSGRLADADEFWDLGRLGPKKPSPRAFASDISTVELDLTGNHDCPDTGAAIPAASEDADTARRRRLEAAKRMMEELQRKQAERAARATGDRVHPLRSSPPGEAVSNEPLLVYGPTENPLIEQVIIRRWPSKYSFYERFRADAIKYSRLSGSRCAPREFFSYMPQYIQLDSGQRAWFLYLRERIRTGEYPETDYSYLLLLIFEIINTPDITPCEEGLAMLCGLWRAYRATYPKLDRYLSEWVCDYCLINRLSPPADLISDFITDVLACSSFKEFYLGIGGDGLTPIASALMTFSSDYNYRKSKYITDENSEFFNRHIKGAFNAVMNSPECADLFSPEKYMLPVTISRDSYGGALCAFDIKRRIEIVTRTYVRSPEIRYTITYMIKYAENNVRAVLGIKSRFHTPNLPRQVRAAIDAYFAPMRGASKQQKDDTGETLPEYERFYEAASTGIDEDRALSIERESWGTTRLLVESFEEDPDLNGNMPEETEAPEETEQPEASVQENEALLKEAVGLISADDTRGFCALADRENMLGETLAEHINARMLEIIGDIAVVYDERNQKYTILEDYREDVAEWMNS